MAEMKFEEALKKLEKIVDDLESGNLSLDDALDKYEEGIKLSKMCAKKLEAAGLPAPQAEAIADAFREATSEHQAAPVPTGPVGYVLR